MTVQGPSEPEPLYVRAGADIVFKTRSTDGESAVGEGIWCRDAAARSRLLEAFREKGIEPLVCLGTAVLCLGLITVIDIADEETWLRLQAEMRARSTDCMNGAALRGSA